MKRLPLYLDTHQPVETATPLESLSTCKRCDLYKKAERTVCINAAGEPGGLLVVGDFPTRDADRIGQAFSGKVGQYLNTLLKKHWDGPIAYTYGLLCPAAGVKLNAGHANACRGYLTQTLNEVKPKRILALGSWAYQALLGRSPPPLTVQRGYSHLSDKTPIFLLMPPAGALRNRFIRKWFESHVNWALTSTIPETPWGGVMYDVCTEEEALRAEADLLEHEWFAFDTETVGVMYEDFFQVLCLAASPPDADYSWMWGKDALKNPKTFAPLARLLENEELGKAAWSTQYDLSATLCGLKTDVRGKLFDGRLMRKLVFSDASGYLADNSDLVGMGGHKQEAGDEVKKAKASITAQRKAAVKGGLSLPGLVSEIEQAALDYPKLEPGRFAFGLINSDILEKYCALDTVSCSQLVHLFKQKLENSRALSRVWTNLTQPAIRAVARIEQWGMPCDKDSVQHLSQYLGQLKDEVEERMRSYGDWDPDSPKNTAQFLFGTLGLTPGKMNKTGPSVDRETLNSLRGQHEVIDDLVYHRELAKMKGTFVDGLLTHIRSDGCIHPSLDIAGARSGRLSCSKPALHQIPRAYTEIGKMVKDCFAAPAGESMVVVDLSQVELRVAAYLSQDPLMLKLYEDDEDFHLETAKRISRRVWNIHPDEVGGKHRTFAKIVNFSLVYGTSPRGLAQQILSQTGQVVSVKECDAIKKEILGQFGTLSAWTIQRQRAARRTGETWTEWEGEKARVRHLWNIAETDDEIRSHNERIAVNNPVQGLASDICLSSLIRVVDLIENERWPAKLVMTVHDSLIFRALTSFVPELVERVVEAMTAYRLGQVPLKADSEWGPTWGSLEPFRG